LKPLQSKISRKLVFYIIVFSSCVTLVLTLIQLRIDYTDGINTIQQRLEQIKLTNLNTITQSLWTLDNDSIEVQLAGLKRIPDIIRIELRNNRGEMLATLGSIDTSHTISREYPIHKSYRDEQLLLGKLKIVATKENLYQKLLGTVLVILVSQAIKTFLVSIFILVIFYYLVTRHIVHIANHQKAVDIAQQPKPLVLPRRHTTSHINDELDRLVTSFNNMADNNYRNYQTVVAQKDTLSKNEARFLAIFNAITDSIIVADTQRRIVLVNAQFHKQFGYDDSDVIGYTTRQLYISDDAYKQQGRLRYQPGSENIPSIYEMDYKRKDGSVFPSETMGAPIKLPNGEHVGFVAIIRDISQRKQTELENKQLLRELQQSQKMESIGHLTGGIAHDFNNILASIIGYTELALSITGQQRDDKLHRYLSHIKTSSERASNLIKQMLAFSRNTPSEPEAINIADILDETINMLQPTLPASIKLQTQIAAGTPPVMMDKTQLQQVIINICVNAKDAMAAEGGLSIRLEYRENMAVRCDSCHASVSGDYVDLSISDTGTGIDSSLLNHIFDPFFTTKEIGKGTGMGLSVVHGILHQHRAHLHIETHLEVGTTFHLLFPAAGKGVTSRQPPAGAFKSINPAFGTGKHILVVDDEELILHYLKSLLEMYGFEITITTSSVEALELIKHNSNDYDLLITDQTMPSITGLGLIRELQSMNVDIPVILCSGYSEKVNAENARELGVMAFIAKPLSQSELLDNLQRLL